MHVIAAFAALGLLVVVLFPIVSKRLRAARRGRAVHLGGSCHWYANYDEELRYEPKRRSDIVRLTRTEVLARGYRPSDDVQVVPRTFRHRVPGDMKIRLWCSDREGVPPLWLCEWATDPVRVSIGVGERERVPGVESVPLPDLLEQESPDSRADDVSVVLGEWKEDARAEEVSAAPKMAGEPEPELTGWEGEAAAELLPSTPDAAAPVDPDERMSAAIDAVVHDALEERPAPEADDVTSEPGGDVRTRKRRRRRR